MRKLLPYEHQLIESLGISKEEYLEFVAIQQEYKDPKAGTALDIRCEPATTTAIVLTVVGVLFQVGAALLAPKPEAPSDGRRRSRQQRFAPSFGFNSTQDLATYGDPINLVYTEQNKVGDVRVAGSLVWSAVDNFGSTQFMRLLVVLGAGEIQKINYNKTAFGQASLADLDKQNVFVFSDTNHNTAERKGPPPFTAINDKFGSKDFYPKTLKPENENKPAFLIDTHAGFEKGFSQAYSPTTSTSLGVFDAIPINVDVKTRDKDGDREESNISIFLDAGRDNNSKWRSAGTTGKNFNAGEKIELHFREGSFKPSSGQSKRQPRKTAADMRRQMVDALDFGSTYMLGSAKFRLLEYAGSGQNRTLTNNKSVRVRFECIEDGRVPGTPYDEEDPVFDDKNLRKKFEAAFRILNAKNDDFSDSSIGASSMVVGFTYIITKVGTTDFTEAGANTNTKGEIFVAEKALSGTGLVQNASIVPVDLVEHPYVNIKFKGIRNTSWETRYTSSVSLDFDSQNYNPDNVVNRRVAVNVRAISNAGSIKHTQHQIAENSAKKPTYADRELRNIIKERIDKLRDLKEAIRSGIFDGGMRDDGTGPEDIFQCNNTYERGLDANKDGVTVQSFCLGFDQETVDKHVRRPQDRNQLSPPPYEFHQGLDGESGGSSDIVGTFNGQRLYSFTFLYIGANGNWHFFNFAGANLGSTEEFQNYDVIKNRRAKIQQIEQEHADLVDEFGGKLNKQKRKQLKAVMRRINKMNRRIGKKVEQLVKRKHRKAIQIINKDIALLRKLIDDVPQGDEMITDRKGQAQIQESLEGLLSEKEVALGFIKEQLDDWEGFSQRFDNNFFSKCLVKAETATYSTLSECNVVNFSFKAKLFRRISGRQKNYGEEKMREFSASDNGVKSRMAFFRMTYKEYLPDNTFGEAIVLPHVFAVRRGSESDFYTQISFYSGNNIHTGTPSKWEFEFTPVYDIRAERQYRSFDSFFFLENTDKQQSKQIGDQHIIWYGREVLPDASRSDYPAEDERGPIYTNEWDMFSVNSDTQVQFSFDAGPEIQLTAVTEQQIDSSYTDKYQDLSMMGVGVFAGRGLKDLRSISALVSKGKLCRTVESLDNSSFVPTQSSSFAPDIFVDTLLDKDNGIGKYIESVNIDKPSLELAKAFCQNNNLPRHFGGGKVDLYMDGLIADAGSWREFWINNAVFSLLELARKNGKETLVPALPVDNSGLAAEDSGLPVGVGISALFTTGNILEGSYKEEFLSYSAATEDLVASVIYREYNGREVFSKNKSVDVKRKDASTNAVRETFDLSQFVTQKEQAVMFGKLLCNQRHWIKKGIEFQTFPSEAVVEPGAFIYVDVGLKNWDQYSSGVVMEGGVLNAPLMGKQNAGTQNFNFLLYEKTTGAVVSLSSVSVETTGDISTAASLATSYVGYMFVMGQAKPQKRVYRVTEVSIEEEGEVSVKAIDFPCFEDGGKIRAHIADFRSTYFDVS